MIVAIDDEQETSTMVERHAEGIAEQANGIASLLGANRELDSNSITIERIASHLSSNSISRSLADKQRHQASNEATDTQRT